MVSILTAAAVASVAERSSGGSATAASSQVSSSGSLNKHQIRISYELRMHRTAFTLEAEKKAEKNLTFYMSWPEFPMAEGMRQ